MLLTTPKPQALCRHCPESIHATIDDLFCAFEASEITQQLTVWYQASNPTHDHTYMMEKLGALLAKLEALHLENLSA